MLFVRFLPNSRRSLARPVRLLDHLRAAALDAVVFARVQHEPFELARPPARGGLGNGGTGAHHRGTVDEQEEALIRVKSLTFLLPYV